MSEALWRVTDELVDRAPSARALRAHGLHLLAGARLRALGRPVPEEILDAEWRAAIATLAVPALLERARAAYDGQLMVMKGPEVALRYPDPGLRAYRDIDLLADDAEAAERALLAAGFRAMGTAEVDDVGYHVCPLVWPGLPLCIELHRWPHWVRASSGRRCASSSTRQSRAAWRSRASSPRHRTITRCCSPATHGRTSPCAGLSS